MGGERGEGEGNGLSLKWTQWKTNQRFLKTTVTAYRINQLLISVKWFLSADIYVCECVYVHVLCVCVCVLSIYTHALYRHIYAHAYIYVQMFLFQCCF